MFADSKHRRARILALTSRPRADRLCAPQHVIHTLRREGVRGWVPLLEGVDGTVGLLTTNSSKEVMCVACKELLADNRLLVSRALLSVTSPPKEVLEQLVAEMRSYMVYVDPPKTLFGKVRDTLRAAAAVLSILARLVKQRSALALTPLAECVCALVEEFSALPLLLAVSAHLHGQDGGPQRRSRDLAPVGRADDADLLAQRQVPLTDVGSGRRRARVGRGGGGEGWGWGVGRRY